MKCNARNRKEKEMRSLGDGAVCGVPSLTLPAYELRLVSFACASRMAWRALQPNIWRMAERYASSSVLLPFASPIQVAGSCLPMDFLCCRCAMSGDCRRENVRWKSSVFTAANRNRPPHRMCTCGVRRWALQICRAFAAHSRAQSRDLQSMDVTHYV